MQRREFIKGSCAVAAAAVVAPQLWNNSLHAEDAEELSYADAVDMFTDGGTVEDGSKIITLNVPAQPTSAVTVPIEVQVDHPMKSDNYVEAITILGTKNKVAKIASIEFTPLSGMAYFFVNAKLGAPQEVVALVKTSDGKIYKKETHVKVQSAGCGG